MDLTESPQERERELVYQSERTQERAREIIEGRARRCADEREHD